MYVRVISVSREDEMLVHRSRHGFCQVGYCEPNVAVVCLQLRRDLAESKAQIALFVATQTYGRPDNTPYCVGELQALAILVQTFQRRVRAIATNLVGPPYGQSVAQPNMTEVSAVFESATIVDTRQPKCRLWGLIYQAAFVYSCKVGDQ